MMHILFFHLLLERIVMEGIVEHLGIRLAVLNERIIENDEAIQHLETKIDLRRQIIESFDRTLAADERIIEFIEMVNQLKRQKILETTQEIEMLKKKIADAKKAKGIKAPVETTTGSCSKFVNE
ncbi:hypothetical protein CAEBREN_20356 [Caenorhabditis brenneri]|uniref:BMERB domain-containing protein n=1 Tax=Caenorhabditis brenneri TaxID=135651 RepID=G0PAJ0_CAEBE|nr:hypothetical protein CAEBREN_20356 [Caenorhabditis brenneri]